jgi:hypothetical protein
MNLMAPPEDDAPTQAKPRAMWRPSLSLIPLRHSYGIDQVAEEIVA